MFYDLVVGALLLWDKTFWIGFFSTMFFHLSNRYIFNIGIFPYLMIATTTMFFEPYWPRRLLVLLSGRKFIPPKPALLKYTKIRPLTLKEWIVVILFVAFLAHQILIPLRYYAYPGDVTWHEHGHRYSWRMKLRDKQCDSEMYAFIPETKQWYEYPLLETMTPKQYQFMNSRPEFMVQYAHFVQSRVNFTIELYMYTACRLNYRPVKYLTNPRVNLVKEEMWEWPYSWVTDMPELTPEQELQKPWNWNWVSLLKSFTTLVLFSVS
jgi:vitamin K-dependent gamma-carboxylase